MTLLMQALTNDLEGFVIELSAQRADVNDISNGSFYFYEAGAYRNELAVHVMLDIDAAAKPTWGR